VDSFRSEALPDQDLQAEGKKGFLRFAVDMLQMLGLALLMFLAINAISARIRVEGYSMEPSLHDGELVIVNKLAYRLGQPRLGDVIVFHYPRDPEQEFIKRVIGVPGDQIRLAGGKVFVNEVRIDEPYIAEPAMYPEQEWVVPEGSLFVLGDNRNRSSDSHSWGPLPIEFVVGKAIVIYWPPPKWGLIALPQTAQAAP
jgi:signal peptidase I